MSKNKTNDGIEALLKVAGKRLQPKESVKNEVYANVYAVWKQQNQSRLYQNRVFLVAASLFTFIGFYAFYFLNIEDTNPLNKSIMLSGQIQVSHNQSDWNFLQRNGVLQAGDSIKTSNHNRLLVELNNGNVFRLDENSRIQLINENEINLQAGQIYIESNESIANNQLIIETDFGSIKHIGTQYNVKLSPDNIDVSVRKGKVMMHTNSVDKEILFGHALSVDKLGKNNVTKITSFDSTWDWTQKISPIFDIQDKSIKQYLIWVSNETGYPIQWNGSGTENAANKVSLSGSIKGISPLESLDVILPTTNFNYKISQDVLHISN
jgi:hypothetical protein